MTFSGDKEPKVNPFMSSELAGEHIRDLHDEAARTRRTRRHKSREASDPVASITLRRFVEGDIDAIRRLADLDEKPIPVGGVLVAESAGELIAALPLDGGQALADPFKPTANVVELLQISARQLREASGGPRHLPTRGHVLSRRLA